jgi:hypothetical protein
MNGQTFGAFQSQFFGVPEWKLVSNLPNATVTEFAYQIWGVPEPGSLLLLAVGGIFGLRRR